MLVASLQRCSCHEEGVVRDSGVPLSCSDAVDRTEQSLGSPDATVCRGECSLLLMCPWMVASAAASAWVGGWEGTQSLALLEPHTFPSGLTPWLCQEWGAATEPGSFPGRNLVQTLSSSPRSHVAEGSVSSAASTRPAPHRKGMNLPVFVKFRHSPACRLKFYL